MASISDSIATIARAAAISDAPFSVTLTISNTDITLNIYSGAPPMQKHHGSVACACETNLSSETAAMLTSVLFDGAVYLLKSQRVIPIATQ